MPTKISLQAYEVYVTESGSDVRLPLDNFDGAGKTLKGELVRFMYQVRAVGDDDTRRQRVVRKTQAPIETPTTLSGVLGAGDYGQETELFNRQTGESEPKASDIADLFKYYYRFDVQPGRTRSIAVLQKISNTSIIQVLRGAFRAFFMQANQGYKVHIDRLVPREVLREYLENGDLREVTITRNHVPRRKTDRLGLSDAGMTPENTTFKEVFRANKGVSYGTPGFLQEIANGERFAKVFSVRDDDVQAVNVEIKVDGETRRIQLDRLERFASPVDVTDVIDYDAGGNPEFYSMEEEAKKVIRTFKKQLGI